VLLPLSWKLTLKMMAEGLSEKISSRNWIHGAASQKTAIFSYLHENLKSHKLSNLYSIFPQGAQYVIAKSHVLRQTEVVSMHAMKTYGIV